MRPLEGLLVLDFSTLLPGPMATLMLAEAGAQVVKIEPPDGDGMRAYAPQWGKDGAIFAMLNRGKQSLAVDLKDPAAKAYVLELVSRADIVVEQFRPGVMDRLGFGYAALAQINPRLIYCSITGFGQFGPRTTDAGHDINYAGDTGLLGLSMGDVSNAVLPPTPIGDIGGGSFPAVINILLALEERRQTGIGRHLDVAMSENIFLFAYWALATGFSTGKWPGNGTELVTGSSPRYRIYATRDRKAMVVGALEQKFWETFCDVVGLPEILRNDAIDPTATAREVATIVASLDASEWTHKLAGKECCCSMMVDMKDAVRDPHFQARAVFSAQVTNENNDHMPALPVPINPAFRVKADGALPSPRLGSFGSATHLEDKP